MDDLGVRPATAADAAAIQAIYEHAVTRTPTSFEEAAPDEEEVRRRMTAAPGLPWLVAAQAGEVVGYAYAARHRERAGYRWSAESSVYVAEGHRGRGVGRRLYTELVVAVRDLRYRSLLAGITLPNAASVRLHESLGFQPVGVFRSVGFKHGAWHDVAWWQLTLNPASAAPDEPLRWGRR